MSGSDEIRKQLRGVEPLERLGSDDYAADVNRRVYAAITSRAAHVVASGHAAMVPEHLKAGVARNAEHTEPGTTNCRYSG